MQTCRDQFDPPLATNAWKNFRRTRRWANPEATNEEKVRSYLQGNCAVCHQPGGPTRGNFDVRITTPLSESGLIYGTLVAGDMGIPGARVVVPGEPEKSISYQRMRPGIFQMPPGVFYQDDSPIAPVMARWIRSLKAQ